MGNLSDAVLTYSFIKRFILPFDKWPAYKAGIIDKDGNVLKTREQLSSEDEKVWGTYDLLIANMKKLLAKLPGGKSRLNLWAAVALLLKEGETLDPNNVDLLKEKFDGERSKLDHVDLKEGIRFRSAFANEKTPAGWMKPHKVDAWHQSRANGWCVQVLDKHGNQVGDAEYHYHKKDAMHAKKQLMKHHNLHESSDSVIRNGTRVKIMSGKHIGKTGRASPTYKDHFYVNHSDGDYGVHHISKLKVLHEDAAVNAVGGGHIAGTHEAGDDPPVRKKAWDKYKRKNKKFSDMPFARRAGANNG